MERSEVIKEIKILVEDANNAIEQKDYQLVYEIYTKIADLCNEIGDSKNADNYTEAANRFKKRTEIAQHQKDLHDGINRAIALAKIANQNKEYSKVSDIYYKLASMLHDLGEEESAQKFSEAARKFREKVALEAASKEVKAQVSKEVRESVKVTPISQFTAALQVGIEAEKELPPIEETQIPFIPSEKKLTLVAPPEKKPTPIPPSKIASRTKPEPKKMQKMEKPPTTSRNLPTSTALSEMGVNIDKLNSFLIELGLKCPKCGQEITESDADKLKKCPRCKADLF